jgi:hypothetical protein
MEGGVKELARDDLKNLYHLTLKEAAKKCNKGSTSFKKECRRLGIVRWPHRRVQSLQLLRKEIENIFEGTEEKQVPL